MCQSAQPPHVLALEVGLHAQQACVVRIADGEGPGVEQLLLLQAVGRVEFIAEHDAQSVAADGAVAQQRVGVGLGAPLQLVQRGPVRGHVVHIYQREAR